MQEIIWNPTRQVWETEQADLFSGQREPYSATWPTSGMTRNGRLLPLPMSGHRIGENECSSSPKLPTPKAHDGVFGTPRTSGRPIEKSTHLQTIVGLLSAPNLNLDAVTPHFAGRVDTNSGCIATGSDDALNHANAQASLLPTPRATDGMKGGPNQRGSSGDLMLPSAVMNLDE